LYVVRPFITKVWHEVSCIFILIPMPISISIILIVIEIIINFNRTRRIFVWIVTSFLKY